MRSIFPTNRFGQKEWLIAITLMLSLGWIAKAGPVPKELLGDWSLIIGSGEAGWMSIGEKEGEPQIAMTVNVGTIKPLKGVKVEGQKIHVPLKTFREGGKKGPILRQDSAVVWSEGGKWQTYDLTLVDRHVTVVLNGEMVIDNQPVTGPTAGAMHTDPMAPGPIYLQGDHSSVKYRNIVLTPVKRPGGD